MREQGKGEATGQTSEQPREAPEEAYRKALPAEFVAVVGQAAPEIVGMLIANHPQMAKPLMTAINQLRGHGFAQQAIAAAMAHPQHKPTPPSNETRPTQPPTTVAPPDAGPAPNAGPKIDPKVRELRAVTGWSQLATAIPDESLTPEHVRIPDNIVQAVDRAWKETVAAKPEKETGGNIVKNGGSGYDVRRYGGDANGDTFQPDDHEVGWRQKLVGMVHTHPYDDFKETVPEGYASFSEQDFDAFMRSDAHLSVLRSGPFTFMLSKTKQFEQLVSSTNNDEAKLRALAAKMTTTYDKVFDQTKGRFADRVEAGVLAVCREFHLVYYEGQGGELTRKSSTVKA